MTKDITDLVRRKSRICSDRQVVKPEFGFFVGRANVNMGGLAFLHLNRRMLDMNPSEEPSALIRSPNIRALRVDRARKPRPALRPAVSRIDQPRAAWDVKNDHRPERKRAPSSRASRARR